MAQRNRRSQSQPRVDANPTCEEFNVSQKPALLTREGPPEASFVATFRGGFLVGISNPKLLIFAAAFFPQFITSDAPWLPQFALLVATFVAVELTFYVVYALGGRRLAAHLVRGVWRRRLNRASGVIFAGFGLALLRYRPQ